MGGFFEPQTTTTPREPADVTQFRTETLQPFFQQLFAQGPQGGPFGQVQGPTGALNQLVGGGGLGAGQQVIQAAQPIFEQNLQSALSQNQAQVSSPFNTAFGLQNLDTTQRALQDFNLFQQQALQQGQQTALDAAGLLNRMRTEQVVNPTLRLLLGGAGLGQPIPADVAAGPSLFSDILGAGATAGGLALGGAFGGGDDS